MDEHRLDGDHRRHTLFNGLVRAILSWRILSASPSAVFGVAVANPASTARAAFSVSRVSDFPFMRRSRRSGRPASTTL
ncbi:hypothetical protein [Streptomyces sp. NPDC003393]